MPNRYSPTRDTRRVLAAVAAATPVFVALGVFISAPASVPLKEELDRVTEPQDCSAVFGVGNRWAERKALGGFGLKPYASAGDLEKYEALCPQNIKEIHRAAGRAHQLEAYVPTARPSNVWNAALKPAPTARPS